MPSFYVNISTSDILAELDDDEIISAYNELGLTPELDIHRASEDLITVSDYLRVQGRLDLAIRMDELLNEIRG